MERRSRRSRRRTKPSILITDRDIEILRLLARHRYLRSTFLNELAGGSANPFRKRLEKLFDTGYINRPAQQFEYANYLNRPLIYELDSKGAQLLVGHGDRPFDARPHRESPHHHFAHDLMISDIMASVEIGVRADSDLRLLSPLEVLARAPEATRQLKVPFAFVVEGDTLAPDAVFGLKTPAGFIVCFVEADRSTESVARTTSTGTDYAQKFRKYETLVTKGLYKAHLGTKAGALVLHVTTSEQRMNNLMTLAGPSAYNLYKTMPSLGRSLSAPPSSSGFISEPWARNGYQRLSLARPSL